MCKKILLSIVVVFGFINVGSTEIRADANTRIIPAATFVYGDPCRHYDFRLRNPEQCDVEYDLGVTLFPFFGGDKRYHHHGGNQRVDKRLGGNHYKGNHHNKGGSHHRGGGGRKH
jgi:hypothetical protein